MAKSNANNELSEELKLAIDSYGNEIKTLEDFVTAVKMRYGMYIGAGHSAGFLNMIREIFQNAVDQLIDNTSPCNHVFISYDMRNLEVVVKDNGKGLPAGDMIRILTKQHTSKNYTKKEGEYSSGMNGVGAKVVNALSVYYIAESYKYDGTAYKLEMREGYPTTKAPVKIPNKDCYQGTIVRFCPNVEILGSIDLDWEIVYRLVKMIISLTPIGSVVDFVGIGTMGDVHEEHIVNTDGILTDLIMKTRSPFVKPIVYGEDNGTNKIEVALVYDAESLTTGDTDARITSFCNWCPTTEGTHIDGVRKGIESWFSSYMNKIYLNSKNNKTKVINADINVGLCVMINAACLEPIFSGQSKHALSNPEMEAYAKEVTIRALDEWSKKSSQDLNKLCKYFKEIADIRMKADKDKAKITDKFEKTFSGYPAKYVKPEGTKDDGLELLICEGDSAKGSIVNGRDRLRQGVFPIRGKIINPFKNSRQKVMSNAEFQGISKIILDGPYTKNFDISKIRWSKIIFFADADVDGGHICTLLLSLFLLYFPQLVEAGMVYKAIPPLFGVQNGKKTKYFTERLDIVQYIQKEFASSNTICDDKGNAISNKDLSIILARNIDYTYELNKIATTYAVDPTLLEMVILNHINNNSPSYLKKQIKSNYRFLDMHTKNNISIIEGAVGNSYDTLYMTDQLIAECKPVIDILTLNDQVQFTLNGNLVSLYNLMTAFEASSPKNIQRFKGLGEMSHDKLAESCLTPNGQRILQRYTLSSAKEELESIREYESNSKLILKEIKNVTRTELLG